jgi:hypothetical protein
LGGELRKIALGILSVVFSAIPMLAQGCPPIEVYGQYSYLNIDTKQLMPRQHANGWTGGAAVILTRSFAAEFEVSGYYNTSSFSNQTLHVHDYYFLGGPRISYKPLFFHALFGGDHLTDGIFSGNVSQQGFAMAIGAGAKWKIKGPWSIKGSADYVLSRHTVFNTSSFGQDNYRASVGIAYTFGYRSMDMK